MYKKTVEFWDEIFEGIDAVVLGDDVKMNQGLKDGIQWLSEDIESAIDFGCGRGIILTLLCKFNDEIKKCKGIDISSKAIHGADKNIKMNKISDRVELSIGGTEELSKIEGKSFQGAVLSNIVDNILPKDCEKVLKEMNRILIKGGKLLLKLNPHHEHETMVSYGAELIQEDFYREKEGIYLRNLSTEKWTEILQEFFEIESYKEIYYQEHDQYNRLFLLRNK